jgi:cytochrome b pre-mRNA-processing protein 3
VSERFVEDMDAVFREMGVSDPAMPTRMKTLYGSFAGRMTAYAEALAADQPELAAALGRNVFPGEPPDGRAERLAEHLRAAVAAIEAAALSDLRSGVVPFPKLDAAHAEPIA